MQNLNPPQTQDEFLSQLNQLEQAFKKMRPVLEVTLRDPALDVEGFIVVHNTAISLGGPLNGMYSQGCGKGGTRIAPDVDMDTVKMLAHKMALKNAASGLPLGGSKSGLRADPDDPNFEQKYKRFVELSRSFLYENGGCFGGFGFDIGARPEHALWACDTLGSFNSFTGKPAHMGGTDYDREGIAGYGVAVAARAYLDVQDKDIKETRFIVQGAGAMGAAVIRYFNEFGAILVGVTDPRLGGAWELSQAPSAMLVEALSHMDFEKASACLKNEATSLDDLDDAMYRPCDILFPCALQNAIDHHNAHKIQAKAVVEGANGPCTNDAYYHFHQHGIDVVPDFMANSGGVIAAFTELTEEVDWQINAKEGIKAQLAKDKAQFSISKNIHEMMSLIKQFNIRPDQAGLYMSLRRLFCL